MDSPRTDPHPFFLRRLGRAVANLFLRPERPPGANVIESAFSIVEQVCKNVERWRGGGQRERWVGWGLMVAERQFRRITGYQLIPVLIEELDTLTPPSGYCQTDKGVVKWVTRESLLSTEFRTFPAANPFGLSAFTNDPSQDGAQTVEAGQPLHFRYRMIVHAGDAKSIDIPALYAKFAAAK
jgi:hypothetical protein